MFKQQKNKKQKKKKKKRKGKRLSISYSIKILSSPVVRLSSFHCEGVLTPLTTFISMTFYCVFLIMFYCIYLFILITTADILQNMFSEQI